MDDYDFPVFLQRLPKNSDEANLLHKGHIKPFRIVCSEDVNSYVPHHKIFMKYEVTDKAQEEVRNMLYAVENKTFIECNPYFDLSTEGPHRTFKFSHQMIGNGFISFVFELDQTIVIPKYIPSKEIELDKGFVEKIIGGFNSNYEKAQNLVTLLLDRQMILDDGDDNCEVFKTAEYAEFYDQTIELIKILNEDVYKSNIDQIYLPELKHFVLEYGD